MSVAVFKMDGGVNFDTRSEMVPPNQWTELVNLDFGTIPAQNHGVATKVVNGQAPTWTTPAVCGPQYAMDLNILGAASRVATNYRWYFGPVYGGVNVRFGQQLAGVDTNVTPGGYPAVAPGRFTGGLLNNFVPFINHQTVSPYYWDYVGVAWNILPNLRPGTVNYTALRAYREYLIGMGRLVPAGAYYSDVVDWSVASLYNAPPATWIPAAGNDAGEAVLPGGGEIVDGGTLGQDFIIYKRDSVYRMTYTGGNYVMAIRPLFKGFGAWSQNSIVEFGGKHYVFTGRDLIVHDGQRWESLISDRVRSQINGLGVTGPLNSFLSMERNPRRLWLCLTRAGATWPGVAIVVDTDTGHGAFREIPTLASIVEQNNDGSAAVIGTYVGTGAAASGRFYSVLTHQSGISSTVSITRKHLDFGDPSKLKVVKWVRPHIRGSGTYPITVEVAGTMNTDDTLTYGTAAVFNNTTSDKADVFAQGRWLSFRFGTTGEEDPPWSISGFEVGYELRGTD